MAAAVAYPNALLAGLAADFLMVFFFVVTVSQSVHSYGIACYLAGLVQTNAIKSA